MVEPGTSSSLTNSTTPALTEKRFEAVSKLFIALPSRNADVGEMKAMIKVYLEDFSDLPDAELIDVIGKFRRGDLGDGKWRPAASEIRIAVLERLGRSPAQLAAKAEFDRRMADRDRREAEWRKDRAEGERRRADADERSAHVGRLLGGTSLRSNDRRGMDWIGTESECETRLAEAAAGRPSRPVTSFSEKLKAQLNGELPIGEGKLGPQRIVATE